MHPLITKQIKAKRVLVTGDRDWANRKVIARELGMCSDMVYLCHGCCIGADYIANELGLVILGEEFVRGYPADWYVHGNAAGPIRNQQMLDDFNPDFVLAFHKNLANSKGTADMVKRAKEAGIPVKIIGA